MYQNHFKSKYPDNNPERDLSAQTSLTELINRIEQTEQIKVINLKEAK